MHSLNILNPYAKLTCSFITSIIFLLLSQPALTYIFYNNHPLGYWSLFSELLLSVSEHPSYVIIQIINLVSLSDLSMAFLFQSAKAHPSEAIFLHCPLLIVRNHWRHKNVQCIEFCLVTKQWKKHLYLSAGLKMIFEEDWCVTSKIGPVALKQASGMPYMHAFTSTFSFI